MFVEHVINKQFASLWYKFNCFDAHNMAKSRMECGSICAILILLAVIRLVAQRCTVFIERVKRFGDIQSK